MLQWVAVCCTVLQCVAVWCTLPYKLEEMAQVCCSVCAVCCTSPYHVKENGTLMQGVRILICHCVPINIEKSDTLHLWCRAQVIALRAKTEGIEVEADALVTLSQIGERATLRYAVQLLTPASIIAKTNGRSNICSGDVEECDNLFFDAKSSAKHLSENADKYIT